MNKFLTGLTVTALTAGAMLLVGCESSNKSNNGLEPGDLESQEYQQFSEVAGGLNDATGDMVAGAFEQAGMIYAMGSSSPSKDRNPFANSFATSETDSFTATYNDVTHYWHTYWSYSDSSEGVTAVFRDSIQFREGMNAVQWPDSATVTEIRCGQLASIYLTGDSGTITLNATSEWIFAGEPGAIPGGGEVIINGGVNHQAQASGLVSGCNVELEMTADYDGITTTMPQLQTGESCPTSGVTTLTGAVSSVCETEGGNGTFDGNWFWQATFNEGMVSISANNGVFEWTYEGECGSEITQ